MMASANQAITVTIDPTKGLLAALALQHAAYEVLDVIPEWHKEERERFEQAFNRFVGQCMEAQEVVR